MSELPKNAILLSSDKVNNVMGVSFSAGNSEIIGLQYHPDYEYFQMLNLKIGRAHVRTPVTRGSRMPSSA